LGEITINTLSGAQFSMSTHADAVWRSVCRQRCLALSMSTHAFDSNSNACTLIKAENRCIIAKGRPCSTTSSIRQKFRVLDVFKVIEVLIF